MKPFIPKKLPLELNDKKLIQLNKKVVLSHKLITEFNTRLEHMKFNKTLFYLFDRNESIHSTKIEGTQSTLSEVLEIDITSKHTNDFLEIKNYIDALNLGIKELENIPISSRLIKKIHAEMLKSGRGSNTSIGNFRKVQNWIGYSKIESAIFIPPEPQLIDEYMSNLEKYINEDSEIDDLIKIAIIHSQFETIHPFLDGNGRVGRILIVLYLYSKGIINNSSFYISQELEKKKLKYYTLLNGVRKDEWYEFIDFFLECIINQSKLNINKLLEINKLYETLKNNVKIKEEYLKYIFQNPVFNINMMKDKFNISYTTANKIVKILEKEKIIFTNQKKRNKLYYFIDFIDIF